MYQTSENKNLDTSQQCDDFCVKLDKATCFSSLFYGLNINTVRLFVYLKSALFLVCCYFLKFCSSTKITVIELNPQLFCPGSNQVN